MVAQLLRLRGKPGRADHLHVAAGALRRPVQGIGRRTSGGHRPGAGRFAERLRRPRLGGSGPTPLAMLAPVWGLKPLLDIDEKTARDNHARAAV
ncbi:hypothetical protein AB0J17_41120, partial [Streptomyces sp. NPDC049949]